MLITDTNLLRAVTKYDSAGRLRPGHASPSVTQQSSGWRHLVGKINCALHQLRSPSTGPITGTKHVCTSEKVGFHRTPSTSQVIS